MTLLGYFVAINNNLSFSCEPWFTRSLPLLFNLNGGKGVYCTPISDEEMEAFCAPRSLSGLSLTSLVLCPPHLPLKYSLVACHCRDQWPDPCCLPVAALSLRYGVVLESLFTQWPPRLILPMLISYSCECPQEVVCPLPGQPAIPWNQSNASIHIYICLCSDPTGPHCSSDIFQWMIKGNETH